MPTDTLTTAAPASVPAGELLDRLAHALSKRRFFVVGCQKSGTTWVQRLLDGHPRLCCYGETYLAAALLPLLKQVQQAYNQRQNAGELGQMTDQHLLDLFRAAVAIQNGRVLEQAGDVDAIGEKTPEHALCIPALAQTFPEAKFIHIIRDGRDACVSGWFHNLRDKGDAFRQKFPTMSHYIQYMVQHHWMPYIQRARAFGAAQPARYLELHYESLHAEPTAQIARMLQFLEVDDSEASIAACAEAGAFQTLADGRDQGQEDRGSFFRKGVTGDWKNHFDDNAIATFNHHGGQMLRELGYET
ncbi:MAG: sulfotransferase family protein [bacterium]